MASLIQPLNRMGQILFHFLISLGQIIQLQPTQPVLPTLLIRKRLARLELLEDVTPLLHVMQVIFW
jgi:hypothetical protein